MSPKNQPVDYSKPVAYDAEGRPLYAHPPTSQAQSARQTVSTSEQAVTETQQQESTPLRTTTPSHISSAPDPIPGAGFDPATRKQYGNEPDLHHVTRPVDPPEIPVSDDNMKRHEEAKREYPTLNLTKGEHVIMVVHRHPIGLVIPIGMTAVVLVMIFAGIFAYPGMLENANNLARLPSQGDITLIGLLLAILVTIFGYIATWVYLHNRFILTNESVIQEIQHSLFSKHEQTASLGSIEDVSYKKSGILQVLLDYGSLRLSTEGEETTYRFYFVSNPKKQSAILNNAVEDFKNGRPVSVHDS